jgi:hypothetical protein
MSTDIAPGAQVENVAKVKLSFSFLLLPCLTYLRQVLAQLKTAYPAVFRCENAEDDPM